MLSNHDNLQIWSFKTNEILNSITLHRKTEALILLGDNFTTNPIYYYEFPMTTFHAGNLLLSVKRYISDQCQDLNMQREAWPPDETQLHRFQPPHLSQRIT